ncbi:transcription factor DIVARICATA-like [Cynara cardunculus var. scolymus]|uniref:Homeodomain-like protein n=1 Tax=Cynara cardunculus var. scolymus TaxID=59895 RepID=A0A118K1U4_CYNCS|nr:transcription factor DIVARICATA-like [Cynara cardunculus var. scolymus]KVI03332.1 Homeodomain-like protein [Cynara cardunculus var. scolymus]
MNRATEIPSPSSYFRGSTLFFEGTKETEWTLEENKRFEDALALFDKETPDRWHNVAQLIPGKTVVDVINHYRKLEEDISEIEAGVCVVPGYSSSDPVTLEWVANNHPQFYSPGGKRSASNRLPDQEKKKGIPWTEEEHRQFLLGLKKYGKGDWRNISRNFVTSRTPTQVASHAQKYFIRQLSGGKDKRRSSIHDITTVHLNDTRTKTQLPENDTCPKPSECTTLVTQPPKPQHHHSNMSKALYKWSLPNQQVATNMAFNLPNSSLRMAPLHGSSSYGSQYGHLGTVFQGNC